MEKLSSDAKQLIDAAAVGQGGTKEAACEIDVLVRTTRILSTDDQSRLESLGATVRTIAGDVLTARVPVNRLRELADLDVVAYVEISRPLTSEGSRKP